MNNLVHKNKNKDLPPKNSLKRNVSQRVLLDKEIMSYVNEWVTQLKRDSCKVSVSKVVNTSLKIFFQKYESLEYENVARGFFDKKSYLIKLIQSSNNENMDESIKLYLDKVNISKKKLGRKTQKEGFREDSRYFRSPNEATDKDKVRHRDSNGRYRDSKERYKDRNKDRNRR